MKWISVPVTDEEVEWLALMKSNTATGTMWEAFRENAAATPIPEEPGLEHAKLERDFVISQETLEILEMVKKGAGR